MNPVIDVLLLRRPKIDYLSPAICEAVFSSTGFPVIILNDIGKLPGPTGLVIGGVGHNRFSWDAYPGALCYNIYSAVFDVTDITECERLVAESATVSYQIIEECHSGTTFTIPHQGCYRVSAITPDGESDLSAPVCSCDFSPTPIHVCNDSQTATCTPPQTGTPVTIPAGTFCVDVFNPADVAAAKANMNAQALAEAESELSCSGPPPPGSLFAYYKMDETPSGTRADSVGTNPLKEADLIFFPNDVFSSVGIINNGADFTGDAGDRSYLVTDSSTAFSFVSSFSVSFWMFPRDPFGSEEILTISGMQIQGGESVNPGQLVVRPFMRTPGPTFVPLGQFDVPYDTWAHLVLTWDATLGQAKIYVNGVLNSTQSGIAALDTANEFMRVGGSDGGVGVNTFAGHVDELGWWTKVLTLAEVTSLYNGGAALALGSPGFPS